MKKIKQFFVYIINRTKHNWGLKLLSLFFAIMLWNSVITTTNPEVTRTAPNVPISVVGTSQLSEKNLALENSIYSFVKTASVTLDIKRNDLEGLMLTKKIKTRSKHKHTPVISITETDYFGFNALNISWGCDSYVMKPVDETELLEKMDDLMEKFFY